MKQNVGRVTVTVMVMVWVTVMFMVRLRVWFSWDRLIRVEVRVRYVF